MKLPVLPLLAAAAIAWAGYNALHSQTPHTATQPPAAPPRSYFAQSVAAVGLVEPSSEAISLGSPRSGVVDAVFVKVGDAVKKDQPLLKLRTRELEAERTVALTALAQAECQVSVAERQASVAEAQTKIARAELAQAQRLLDFASSVRDSRVLSDEERTQRAMVVATQQAKLESAQASMAAVASQVKAALAEVEAAKAKINVIEVDIDRSTIKAPLDASVLQIKVRAGEYVNVANSGSAWLTIGSTQPLHVRADVDEHEAWRVQPGATAEAQMRGNPALKVTLTFVRFEPLVIPKKSLTGDATERVDTRVLQVIYRIDDSAQLPLFVGQQMDVFIKSTPDEKVAMLGKSNVTKPALAP